MTLPDIESIHGLSEKDAAERLKTFGYNELPQTKKNNITDILLEVAREPMFLLLVASGLIYLILGDHTEAIMLMSFVVIIIGITVY